MTTTTPATRPTMEQAKAMLTSNGYTPSARCWEDESRVEVFSIEASTPGTYGHPDASVRWMYGSLIVTTTETKLPARKAA